jgi:hypothetical protein
VTFKVAGDPGVRPGEVCERVGHPEGRSDTTHCGLCGVAVQWVRVEVYEGKAYTYMAFEEPPLERGEAVVLPGNIVQSGWFTGTVLRLLDGPSADYDGPYKAVVGRAEPRDPCTCGVGYDDDCPKHGGLL